MPVGPLFPSVADEAMDVFNNLTLVDAPNGPEILGTLCRPWIKEIAATLFGSFDPQTKRRLITNYFLTVSKKNGKSSLASAVMLTALILNHRPSAEFIILAPTKEIAEAAYKPIRDMIKAEPELEARFHEQWHYKTITDRLNGSVLKVVAADSATVTGKKATGVFIDELHEFGKSPKAAYMLTEATGGLASRPEGFVFYCTTQSSEPPAGVFADKLAYARAVRDGRIKDKRFLPIIYEFPKSWIDQNKHRDINNAYITNPNWGLSVDADFIEQKMQEAVESGEHAVKDILSKHMNVETGLALRADRWPGAEFWESTAIALSLEDLLSRCEVVDIGIDGGGLDDLLGLYVIGRETEKQTWLGWGHAWAHPSVLERRKEIAPAIQDYAAAGNMTLVKRIGDDVEGVADIVEQVMESGLLDKVGVDPVGIGAILDKLEERGIPQDKVTGVSQGWKLGGAIKTAERRLAEGTFQHADQPVMNWCVGNARVEPRANSILITKQASGSAKIDPLMALFNAVTLMSLNPAAANRGVKMFMLG
jgi:phage terminase large subunit-like protein